MFLSTENIKLHFFL